MTAEHAMSKICRSYHLLADMKMHVSVCLTACLHWHILQPVWLQFSNSTQFGFRQKEVSFRPMVFAPSVFSTGLRVFSMEIVINLLCADKLGRAGNIKTCREKSPWIIWNPVWMFCYIASERLSRSCSHFSASVSLILLFWCFPLPLSSLFQSFSFSDVLAMTSFSRVCLSLSLSPLLCLFLVLAGGLGGFLQIGTQMNNVSKAKARAGVVCQILSLYYSYVES